MKFFITGISKGLGFALAQKLLENNHPVFGLGRTNNVNLANQYPTLYKFIEFDMADSSVFTESLIEKFDIALIGGDAQKVILINSAASNEPVGIMHNLVISDIAKSLNTNLVTPIILSKVFIKLCESKKIPLRIVHVSSAAATKPFPGINLYSISKCGLEMLVNSIHSEELYINIPIESIGFRPGVMDTDMQKSQRNKKIAELPILQMFLDFQKNGLLRAPGVVAQVMYDQLLFGGVDSGRIYSIDEFAK